MTPLATYRLQFTPDFGFDEAAKLAPYLAKLGVSHLYASPYLKARPGSTHGYDITDHNLLNPELGGEAGFTRMCGALRRNGLRQILDFVPNHMGVGGADNPFWLDILEWGPDSVYSGWFDIDWDSERSYLHDKVLVPVLGAQYGIELEAGKLKLKFDAADGAFAVWAYDTHKLPICPLHYGAILGDEKAELERLGDAFSGLPAWRPQVLRRAETLKRDLTALVQSKPAMMTAVEAAVERLNGVPGDEASWTRLHALIQKQFWRAAHFLVAGDDINYRRFFNINDLAGLRMELPSVFDHAHRLVSHFLRDGTIDGLRIDHIDGLLDPKGYLERLRARAPARGGKPFYLVVEKILAPHEPLRADWPVDGTTGYEVTNQLLDVLVDPAGEAAFTQVYADFTGQTDAFDKILRACKKRIMDNEMSSELASLARDVVRVARINPKTSDFTRNILRRALREIVANFPVYRTYIDFEGAPNDADRRYLDEAIAGARRTETAIDGTVFEFLRGLLTGDLVAQPRSGLSRTAVLRAAMRFQQYSGPVMAKGLEDTAFYRYNRFIALNEVGGHPTSFGRPLAEFHAANVARARHWPNAMLGTSTHDTKRGEDARARLAALSEHPDAWADAVRRWSALLGPAPSRRDASAAPDRNDEYAFYQLLVGTCPVELLEAGADDMEARAAYAERLKGAMTKAMREAKVHSTWAAPNAAYEAETLAFVDHALTGEGSAMFLARFRPFARTIAAFGARNSIIQTALKLTIPGVPDLYQGTELWDLSMVDPDNRRPVDFDERARLLDEVAGALDRDRAGAIATYAEGWQDGRIKLAVTLTLLAFRKARPRLFAEGSYEPIAHPSDRTGIFARRRDGDVAVVAFSRFPGRLDSPDEVLPDLGEASRGWTELLTGRRFDPGQILGSKMLFGSLPVAVLVPAERP